MEVQNKTLSYAGFWKRFAALIIDMFILSIGNFFIGFVFGIPYDVIVGKADFAIFVNDYVLSLILSFFVSFLYQVVMESSTKQATFGKMALGIIVTDLFGKRISFGKAIVRYFGKMLSGFVFGMGFIMVAFTVKKQGLHDKIAACLVVNK